MARLGFSAVYISFATLMLMVSLVFAVHTAHAQGTGGGQNFVGQLTYTPINPLPGVNGGTINVGTYLTEMYTFTIGFIIIAAFLMLTYGGFQYVLAATTGGKQGGKDIIWDAIFGLVIALASYLILYTINPDLLNLNIFRDFGAINVAQDNAPSPTTPAPPGQQYCYTTSVGEATIDRCFPTFGACQTAAAGETNGTPSACALSGNAAPPPTPGQPPPPLPATCGQKGDTLVDSAQANECGAKCTNAHGNVGETSCAALNLGPCAGHPNSVIITCNL